MITGWFTWENPLENMGNTKGKWRFNPMVMTDVAVENRYSYWENPLFLWSFSKAIYLGLF